MASPADGTRIDEHAFGHWRSLSSGIESKVAVEQATATAALNVVSSALADDPAFWAGGGGACLRLGVRFGGLPPTNVQYATAASGRTRQLNVGLVDGRNWRILPCRAERGTAVRGSIWPARQDLGEWPVFAHSGRLEATYCGAGRGRPWTGTVGREADLYAPLLRVTY